MSVVANEVRPLATPRFRTHERVEILQPGNVPLQARVELVTPRSDGRYSMVAAITEPRRLRSRVVTVLLDQDGSSHIVRSAH